MTAEVPVAQFSDSPAREARPARGPRPSPPNFALALQAGRRQKKARARRGGGTGARAPWRRCLGANRKFARAEPLGEPARAKSPPPSLPCFPFGEAREGTHAGSYLGGILQLLRLGQRCCRRLRRGAARLRLYCCSGCALRAPRLRRAPCAHRSSRECGDRLCGSVPFASLVQSLGFLPRNEREREREIFRGNQDVQAAVSSSCSGSAAREALRQPVTEGTQPLSANSFPKGGEKTRPPPSVPPPASPSCSIT